MTKHLKSEVLIDIYMRILKQSRLLKDSFSEQTLRLICQCIKEKKFAPDEEIFYKSDVVNKLIFVMEGEVMIFLNDTDIKSLGKGTVIGEREFASKSCYNYSARAIEYTKLALLE